MEKDALSGSNMIKVSDGVQVFLSQLDSCTHSAENFECLTPIKFDWIIDIKKFDDNDE